ncbi:MAG: hypothetical protein KGQ66_12100, partial [Acidobacteriota bacterium]|nr:hypothetical protein [Acidobacteriota bacterium]
CNRKAGLEYEHRIDWQHTHYTVYDLMDRLCWFHHQQKTNHGWMLIEGAGKRAFVAPDDPRHPRHHSPAPPPPPSSDQRQPPHHSPVPPPPPSSDSSERDRSGRTADDRTDPSP